MPDEAPVSMNPEDYESPPALDKRYFIVVGMDPKKPGEGFPFVFVAANETSAAATATAITTLLKAQWFTLWDAATRKFVCHVRGFGDAMAMGARINEIAKAVLTPGFSVATQGMEEKFRSFSDRIKARRAEKEGR